MGRGGWGDRERGIGEAQSPPFGFAQDIAQGDRLSRNNFIPHLVFLSHEGRGTALTKPIRRHGRLRAPRFWVGTKAAVGVASLCNRVNSSSPKGFDLQPCKRDAIGIATQARQECRTYLLG